PLVEPDQVRGGVETDAVPRLPEDARDERARGALPIRPGDVDRLEPVLRVPDVAEEFRDRLEAELDPEPLEAVQLVQERLVVHRAAANPARGLKVGSARLRE